MNITSEDEALLELFENGKTSDKKYKNLLAELKNRLKISIFLWRKSCASR